MDAKAKMQLIAAGAILTVCLASFVLTMVDHTYAPPVSLMGFGMATVTWLFGSAVKDEINRMKKGNDRGKKTDDSE